jgi:hypothetical protein
MRPAHLIVATVAAFAMAVFVNTPSAFAQDAPSDSGGAADASPDANWDPVGPGIDEAVEAADKVLEIPQVTCAKDGAPDTCDSAGENADDDDNQAVNAAAPDASPTLDDDTASAAPNQDWGTLDDYQNQEADAPPYLLYPYPMGAVATMNRPSALPASAYVPMSSPLTQAARPPLNPGPWMTPARMATFNRRAGSPMMGLTMSHPIVGFHH